jgi:hypothetical protein
MRSLKFSLPASSAAAFTLVAGLAMAVVATPASAQPISYIYGIDDSNNIWEINPVGQTASQVFATGLPGTANSNAFAYDKVRENMFFLNGSGTSSQLYVWNKPTNSLSIAATAAQLGVVDPNPNQQAANAAYNAADGRYWFFQDGTDQLYSVAFSYTGNIPTFNGTTFYTVGGGYGSSFYGDIAIDPTQGSNGLLYGSTTTGEFFSLDLSDAPNSYNNLGTSGVGLQLSFNSDYTTLYGQDFSTKEWYTVDTGSGAIGSSFWTLSDDAFRDLGGSSETTAAIPEIDPTAFGGVLALVLGSLGLLERRRLAVAV